MHLKQLKLAGFKSFVEPTVVPFSGQLVAVVGPNGCGKSNIIDAVRWVMGESSAKNLRGESMADVIFNGSSQRKSVGQASVELIFDNTMGRLTGPYANYQEIAVKRLVTRDGDSCYYLNGSRCRRRDITDIFLGTGAGARGYSIIGQDTISRLVVARPEEIRAYLEEAAGVSKYKERRRETLQRIGHTRENLVRVADIRDELSKQLLRLERQAKAAEHYQALKREEHQCRADILALKWQAVSAEQAILEQALSQLRLCHEQHKAKITRFMKDNTQLQSNLHQAQDEFQEKQKQVYQLKTDIARLEESQQQQLREKQRLAEDKQQIEADLQSATHQHQQDSTTLAASELAIVELQSKLGHLQHQFNEQQQRLDQQLQQKNNWDNQWQQLQTLLNQVQREIQAQQLRLQNLAGRHQHAQLRLEKIEQEKSHLIIDVLQAECLALQTEKASLTSKQQQDEEYHQKLVQKGVDLRQQLTMVEQQLHVAQDEVQTLATEQAAMLAAQNTALSKTKNEGSVFSPWKHHLRLAETLQVPREWMLACELVLGESLQAIVLDDMDTLWPQLEGMQGQAALFVKAADGSQRSQSTYPRLSDKITGLIPSCSTSLDQVFAATNLLEALSWLPNLKASQSIVTTDGYWLGPGWVKVAELVKDDAFSLLARQQNLQQLNENLLLAKENLEVLKQKRDELHNLWVAHQLEQDQAKQTLMTINDEVRINQSAINSKQQAIEQASYRMNALSEEQAELQFTVEEIASEKLRAESQLEQALTGLGQHEQRLQQLMLEKTQWDTTLNESRRFMEQSRSTLHQAELQANKEIVGAEQLRAGIQREQRQIDLLTERLQTLVKRINELTTPDDKLRASLHEKIAQHEQLETELARQKQQVDELQQQLNQGELAIKQEQQQANTVQDKIQQEQLQAQALAVRAMSINESVAEFDTDIDTLLQSIPTEVSLDMREQRLLTLGDKITRLGAINLMAIEEYQTELARKQHLDEQYQDLMTALATLDNAIAKMDKETQLRLKDTFDQVNEAFQILFPRLFGGGRARLELTCDNLLEAGVLVMAQPPGKRNSTIHLLSGGEKAMTAVALVFAIFQQNPSPFCMLDEVDAPLDDLNVRRFCDLVKEMSKFVQFLFITHNKVTMELADHLIGVTMREPGISRVVAVDVVEALSM